MSFLRFSIMILILFPLSYVAIFLGGAWPLIFYVAVVSAHIIIDNFTPPLPSKQPEQGTLINNVFLVLQGPAAVLLLWVLFAKINPDATLSLWLSNILGVEIIAYQSLVDIAMAVAAVGFMFGGNIIVCHELMHRKGVVMPFLSRIYLAITGDAQFQEAHIYGHHVNVGTPADPATARRGENLYKFMVRSTVGQYAESYAFEKKRVAGKYGPLSFLLNRVVVGVIMSAIMLTIVYYLFGQASSIAYLFVMLYAKMLLEAVNYIQHYGLVRVPGTKVFPRHSWDCASRGCSFILYNLSRHSDHHANANKPFWSLELGEKTPMLRHGYMGTILMAFVPFIWFRYVKKPLEAWDNSMASDQERELIKSYDADISRAQVVN